MIKIEKLVKQLRSAAKLEAYYNSEYNGLYNQTADALEKLQAENAQLRAELERVTAERDAAVERLREWEKFDIYLLAHNFLIPEKWCGIQKED